MESHNVIWRGRFFLIFFFLSLKQATIACNMMWTASGDTRCSICSHREKGVLVFTSRIKMLDPCRVAEDSLATPYEVFARSKCKRRNGGRQKVVQGAWQAFGEEKLLLAGSAGDVTPHIYPQELGSIRDNVQCKLRSSTKCSELSCSQPSFWVGVS